MPQPTSGDVHVNRPLTNIAVAFIQQAKHFVATKVFPEVPVMKQSDRYFVYKKDAWYRDEAKERAPASESAGGGFEIDNTPTYFAGVKAFHKDVDDQVRANADQPIDMDRDATLFVSQILMLRKEKVFRDNFFTTGKWAVDTTPATLWDAGGSDPVNDVQTQMEAIAEKTGWMPNKLIVGPQVHRALKRNAAILDRIKYTQKAVITEEILASLFEVDQYMVARATENTAKEGATATMASLYGKDALLVYAAPAPSIMAPSGGYVFTWNGLLGSSAGTRIKRFRMEQIASDRVEGEMAWDMKLVAADLGVFFDNVIT